ncbi:MAG: DUF2192 domain-containing protein [Candidatus Verstraetearchaeota archaeon]|jgi:hypothetical protein|nr:DUF2192 domain-containing protein [Candidatus Verstraetearchaeota archaeon]
MPMNKAYKLHVDACNEVLSSILAGSINNRGEAVQRLAEAYKKRGIGPIRGWSSKNLYDKEMAMVYLVCKRGLGLELSENPALSQIFSYEAKYEDICREILEGAKAYDVIQKAVGNVDKNTIFRALRLMLTAVVLGFEEEDKLFKLHKALAEEFKEYEKGFRSFMKFYVALRVAEKIALREVKNKNEKEALKLAMCMRIGVERGAPPDKLISLIAREVFGVPKRVVSKILRGG